MAPLAPMIPQGDIEQGEGSTLGSFGKGAMWAGSSLTAFELISPTLMSTIRSPANLTVFGAKVYDRSLITNKTEVFSKDWFTNAQSFKSMALTGARAFVSPASLANRFLRQRVVVDYRELAGLEYFFSPFMENRLLKGHASFRDFHRTSFNVGGVQGYQAYGDIYDYGIAKVLSKEKGAKSLGRTAMGINVPGLRPNAKVETSMAALAMSKAMHSPFFRTFSLYPGLMNMAMPAGSQIDASLIHYEVNASSIRLEFTKHNIYYAKEFNKFKNNKLVAHGIDLYSESGLESFNAKIQNAAFKINERRQAKIKKFMDMFEGKGLKVEDLGGLTYSELEKKVGGKRGLGGIVSQAQFNKLKEQIELGPDIRSIFKEAGFADDIIDELPAFIRLQDNQAFAGTLSYYKDGNSVLTKLGNNAIASPRGHGVAGSHLYPSKHVRTKEGTAGITDIDAERMDERWLIMKGDYGSLAKTSAHTLYSRFIRLLDSPGDILSYFSEDETHAEKMASIMDKIEEAAASSKTSTIGDVFVESKWKRRAKYLFMNRFGTGGQYNTSFSEMIYQSLVPGFSEVQEEKAAFYILNRRSDYSKVSTEKFMEATESARDEFVKQLKSTPEKFEGMFSPEGLKAMMGDQKPFIHYGQDAAYVMAPYVQKMKRFRFGIPGVVLAVGGATDMIPVIREPFRAFNLLRAGLGDVTGAHAWLRAQEENAPGSTSPYGLFGATLSGAMAGYLGSGILQKVQLMNMPKGMEQIITRESFEMKRAIDNPYLRDLLSRVGMSGPRTRAGRAAMYGIAAGFLLNLPSLPGQALSLLFGDKSYGELKDEYSGKTPVPIMKGRWWEAGLSHFEGDKLGYYRSSMMAITPKEARDADLYGYTGGNFANIRSMIEQAFTYNIESRNYYRRPYAATASAFGDLFGPMSPIINSTLGELIKPTKMMHREELMGRSGSGGLQALPASGDYSTDIESSTPGEFQAINMPTTDSFFGVDKLNARESFYRLFQEAPGLPGFVGQSLIGSRNDQDIIYDDQIFAERADRMTESRRVFWDMELGGLATFSEGIRRIMPVRRFAEEWQTPIKNEMPSWMPGKGEMINFQEGDPYAQVAAGEMRLPGPGYELLRSDLAGLDASQYDTSTKLQILADIAPYSKAYKRVLRQYQQAKSEGILTEDEINRGTMAQAIRRHMVAPYKYSANIDEENGAYATYHKTVTEWMKRSPFERLIPFAPAHKFGPHRTAIEKYREYLEYGGDVQRWTHPVQDFVSKFISSWSNFFSQEVVPETSAKVEKVRQVNATFNAMEYLKATTYGVGGGMSWKAKNTIPGVNPWMASLQDIQIAMPEQERPYFLAFAEEKSLTRQKLILEMIPKEHQRIYKAIWARKLVHEIRDNNNGLFAQQYANKASDVISKLANSEFSFRGGPFSLFKQSDAEYRADIAREIIEDNDGVIPKATWLGWNRDVKLKDIKLQHVLNEGEDIHDFNLWEPQQMELGYKDKIPEITDQYEDTVAPGILQKVGSLFGGSQSGYYDGEPGAEEYNISRRMTERELASIYNRE